MSLDAVVQFTRALQRDAALKQKFEAASGEEEGQVARDAGFAITNDELRVFQEVTGFWRKLRADPALQKKIQAFAGLPPKDQATQTAKVAFDMGMKFTGEDFMAVTAMLAQK